MLNLEDKVSPKRGNRNGQLGIITKAFSYVVMVSLPEGAKAYRGKNESVQFRVTFTDGKTVQYEESQLQTEAQWNAHRDNVLSAAAALFQQGQR